MRSMSALLDTLDMVHLVQLDVTMPCLALPCLALPCRGMPCLGKYGLSTKGAPTLQTEPTDGGGSSF